MIFQAMELIRQNLNAFLVGPGNPDIVLLGNIAFATPDNPNTPLVDEGAQVLMSMVNIEEEATLRNLSAVRQSEIRPLAYVNPPMTINLYLLFSATHRDYSTAIQILSSILHFFQGNRTFSIARTPVPAAGVFATPGEDENNIKVTLDLMSLTFEQVNHLWGSLGGKQAPFLLFKARQVEIDTERMFQGGGHITEIQVN